MSYQIVEERTTFGELASAHWLQPDGGDVWVASGSYSLRATRKTFDVIFSDAQRFNELAEKWQAERGISSSSTAMILCPSYQAIIGMGPPAIDLILARLKAEGDDPDHWFWALQILTGINPVPEEDEGNVRKMADTWLKWGEGR